MDLPTGASESTVMTRIADKGFNLWFNSSAMKATTLGRMAETAQEKLKTDVVVPASSPKGVSHKFSFRVEAFQALAKMEYTGWLKAAVNYDAKASATRHFPKEKSFITKILSSVTKRTRNKISR